MRDALAGVDFEDIDLATPDLPTATLAALDAAGLRAVPTGIAHGTVTALVGGRTFEVTTLRRDIATDGRHATVAFTDDFEADAARRDFTFNAMSVDRAGTLFDYFGGAADLTAGRVLFVGDPATRIAEDFLRVLRFFRFYARYARYAFEEPVEATLKALREGVPGLARLSPERVWLELTRILQAPAPVEALSLAKQLGVLDAILPTANVDRLRTMVVRGYPRRSLARLAALTNEPVDQIADRLRMSNADRETLRAIREPPPEPDLAGLRRALADASQEIVWGRIAVAGLDPSLIARVASIQPPVFPLQGRDLIAAGATPGPALGQQLAGLRSGWLDGGCVADAAELLDAWRTSQLAADPRD